MGNYVVPHRSSFPAAGAHISASAIWLKAHRAAVFRTAMAVLFLAAAWYPQAVISAFVADAGSVDGLNTALAPLANLFARFVPAVDNYVWLALESGYDVLIELSQQVVAVSWLFAVLGAVCVYPASQQFIARRFEEWRYLDRYFSMRRRPPLRKCLSPYFWVTVPFGVTLLFFIYAYAGYIHSLIYFSMPAADEYDALVAAGKTIFADPQKLSVELTLYGLQTFIFLSGATYLGIFVGAAIKRAVLSPRHEPRRPGDGRRTPILHETVIASLGLLVMLAFLLIVHPLVLGYYAA